MKMFYKSNPGLSSRVAHHIDFPDYTRDELLIIAKKMFEERQYKLSFYAEEVFLKYLDLRKQLPLFANARSVKNITNRACFRLASRVMTQSKPFTYKNLIDITPNDLMLSTLFSKGLKLGKVKKINDKLKIYHSKETLMSLSGEQSATNFNAYEWKNFSKDLT